MAEWDGFKVLSLPGDESMPAPRRDRLSANEAGLARHVALSPDEQAESGAAWEEGRSSRELDMAISDAQRKGDSKALAALMDARDGANPFTDAPHGVNPRRNDQWAGFKVLSRPKGADLSPDALKKTASGDYFDAIGKGVSNLGTSLQSATWMMTGKGTPEIAKALAEQIANNNASAGEREIQDATKAANDAKGGWDTAKSIGNLLWSFASNPYDAGKMVVEQLPNAVPSMIMGAAGAAAGSVAGPAGTLAGGLGGLGAGSAAVEFGAKLSDKVGEALAGKQPTPENIQAILERPGFREAAMQEGRDKGITVGAIDALSAVVGGRIATSPFRAAAKKALAREGVDLADTAAVNAALKTAPMQAAIKAEMAAISTGRKVGMGAAGVAVDSTMEGGGEYLGEYAAAGQGKLGDAILEGVTSLGQSTAEVAGSAAFQRSRGMIGGTAEASAAEQRKQAVPDPATLDREQRKQAIQDIAAAPDVDAAITAFGEATKPAANYFTNDLTLPALPAPEVFPALPSPEMPTNRTVRTFDGVATSEGMDYVPRERPVMVNDTDPELTRPEQFGDRETRINATQRAREEEADAPGVRDIVQTPEGPRRRARVTLDEAHSINPTLTEAALAAPNMGPKAERTVFEAITNGTLQSPEAQSVIARFGLPGRTDGNGQGQIPLNPAALGQQPNTGSERGNAEAGAQGAGTAAAADNRNPGIGPFQIRGQWLHDMKPGALNLLSRNSRSLVERAKARAELDRRNPNREFDRAAHDARKRLWRTIVQAGGISEQEAADIGIDPRSLGGYRMSGLITPNGMRADILARTLAEAGYMNESQMADGGDNNARQIVADLLAREFVGTPDEQNRYHELLAKKHGEAVAAVIDNLPEIQQAEVADYDDSAVAGAEAVAELEGREVSEEEFLRALGASEQEIADVLKSSEPASGESDAQETGTDAAGSPESSAETGSEPSASGEGNQEGDREGATAVAEKPRLYVQSPDGRRFEVDDYEDASRKWLASGDVQKRAGSMATGAVPIVDQDGKTVALMGVNGRVTAFDGSGVLYAPPEADVTPADDDAWLKELFVETAAETPVAPIEDKADLAPVRAAIAAVRASTERDLADWQGRAYKQNKNQVELRGDGPSRRESLSIGGINEARRNKAIAALQGQLAALEKIEAQIATPEGARALMRMLDETWARAVEGVKADAGSRFKTAGDLFEYLVLQDQQPARGAIDSNPLSRALRALKETPKTKTRAKLDGQKPAEAAPEKPSGDTDASLDRTRPREFVAFSKPYEGKTGAKLVGYEWAQRKEEYIDKRGENRTRRVSDWDQAVKNLQTGRDVVHQFHITTKDGESHVVSAETAATMLSVAQSTVRTNAVRLLQQEIEARKKQEADDKRVAELDAMESFPTPAAAIESRKPDGYIARVVDRALTEGKTWGSADSDAPGREKYRFLKRDGKFIFSPELVTDGSALHAAGWRTVELRANEIWDGRGNDKQSPTPVAPAQGKGAAETATAIFGLSGAQLEAMQGGKLRGAKQFTGIAPTEQQVADRKALVAKRKAEEAAAVDKAALDPRIAALRDSGVEAGILLKAEKELRAGDDSLIKDLARIQGIELPAEPAPRETPNTEDAGGNDAPLASRRAPDEAVDDMFGYTDADEDALLLDMDAEERAEYEKSKPRGMSWLDHAKQQYARIKGDYRSLKAKPFVSATYGADLPWQESARNRDGDALRALRSEAVRLEKDAPARLYINQDGTARITVFDARDVPKRMLAFAERNNLKTDVVVNSAMLQSGKAMPEVNRAAGAKYAQEMAAPDERSAFAARPGYTAPYRDLDGYRFQARTDGNGMPAFVSRHMVLAKAREQDALGVPKGGRAVAFSIFDRRMKDANGKAKKVGDLLVHMDADGKFASFRNIEVFEKYQNDGYYFGEGVVAGMLQHNGTTPMQVFNIQSAAKGDEDDALPYWKKIGTTILNNSSDPDVAIEGNISLARYLSRAEQRGNNGQSSRDRREQPIPRRDEAPGQRPDAGGNRRAGGVSERQSGTVRAVRAELTDAFGEDGVAALEREGILNITTWDNAPKGLTNQLQSGDHGAYWPSRNAAYIFADNLTPGQAVEVLLHEIGEHYGLKEMLGDRYDRTVAQVKTLHKAGNKAIVAAWKHVQRNYDLEPGSPVFMQEVIAKAGQSAAVRKMAWWQRMVNGIKAFLLKTGLKGVTSERDLGILLQASVKKAMRDAGAVGDQASSVMAARPDDALTSFRDRQTSSPAFKAWFGDSKIVDANGRPLVVYHRSGPQADFESFVPHKPKTVYRAGDQELIEAMSWDMGNDGQGAPDAYHYMAISDAAFMGAEKALEIRRAEAKTSTHPDTLRLLRDLERLQGKDVVRSTEVRPSGDGSYFTPDPGYSFIRQPGAGAVYPVYLRIENPLYLNSSQIEGAGLDFNVEKYRAMGYDGAIFRSDPTDLTRAKWGEFTQIVIFDGNQAKSAISNNGNFDPNEPGIMASRPGTIGATWDMLQSAKTPAQARTLAMNLFDNPNKFNLWDKTIGTQLNKARKNEYFRAVFDALQAQQDSTAAYAIEAEAEAADVLARMEGMGEIKSALKSTFTGLKFEKGSILPQGERARDLQAVSKAIFSNIEGEQGVKQKVFTDAELAKDFGLNDRQIALYRQSRAAIDRSLDRYAQSLAIRMAQKFVYTGDLHRAGLDDTVEALTERMRLQRQVLEDQKEPEQSVEDMEARLEELKELRQAMPREILRSLQVGPDGETRQEFVGVPDTAAATALEKEIRDVRRSIERGASKENAELDAKIEALDAALSKLPEIAEQANSLKDKGYAPAMRFGDYAVTATQGGETVFFTMVDTKTQANLLKMRLAREMPGAELRVNPVDRESFKLFGGVDPATVELFARFMEVEENDAFKAYIALATSSRSALKHMLERKGIAGFSDNLPRVMAAFITSNSRAAARNIHGFDVNAATEATQKNARGDVSEEAAKLVNYMNNPTGDFAKVRGFMFAYFMGGSVSSALVNLTQPLMMTTPYLEQFAGKKIAGIMVRASKAAATGKVEGPMKAALARAEAEGITDAHEYHQLMQEAEGGGLVATRALMKSWGSMFGAAERFNRRITFLAAFETGQGMTKEQLQAKGVGDAYEFAKNAVVETQGLYNRANRPNWARNPVGALAMTFKQFSIAWVEFFIRLPRKQQLMALGLLILMAGIEGLPFAEDLEDLIDTIGQRMGRGTNSKKALRQAATNILGETGAQFALHGISGLAGMPMDVAGRLGMGNLIPGTKLLNPSTKEKARELAEIAGPAAGLAQKAGGLADGNFKEAMPKAFADAAKAWEMIQTGEYRDTRGRKVMDVDGLDALMKMIGFQPRDVAANTRYIGENMRDVDIVKRVEAEIAEQWAEGIRNKNVEESRAARERLMRWNAENPDLPIKITFAQVLRRVKQANLTRDERFMKTAPPELRRRLLAESAQ